jgi:hypothetical protein
VLNGREALRASPDAENSKEKFEEEKIVGKEGKTVAAPATPKPKVNAPPSGSSSLSSLSDIEDPPITGIFNKIYT